MKKAKIEPKGTHILCIETSGNTCAVGITKNDVLLAEQTASVKNIHSKVLLSFVTSVLSVTNVDKTKIAGIAISAGPGSFTGLRIGYSIAKGLAHSLQIPIIEVPTLDIWAQQSGEKNGLVLAISNAHREELFGAIYQWESQKCIRKNDYKLFSYEQITAEFPNISTIVGNDAIRFREAISPFLNANQRILQPQPHHPQLWAMAQLAFTKFLTKAFSDTADCEPLYIRTFHGVS